MRADGMTCRLRYSPVTKGLCGTERIIAGDPHSDKGSAITFRQPGMCLALRVMS